MAVPTITSVSPTSGTSAGRVLVSIIGTGFREPASPPATGPAPIPEPSVSVSFGTAEAEKVWVLSTTELLVLTGASEPGLKSCVVQNLDDDGEAIVGESATLADCYTTKLPDLTDNATITRVTERVWAELHRQVLDNTRMVVHTEYDSDTGDLLSIVDTATLPSLLIIGPRTTENRFQSTNETEEVDIGDPAGLLGVLASKMTVDLTYTIVGVSDSKIELSNLLAHFIAFVHRNIYLRLDRDPADASAGKVQYEFDFVRTPEVGGSVNTSNLVSFTGEVVVRGVDVEPGDMVTGKVAEVADRTSPTGEVSAWFELASESLEDA